MFSANNGNSFISNQHANKMYFSPVSNIYKIRWMGKMIQLSRKFILLLTLKKVKKQILEQNSQVTNDQKDSYLWLEQDKKHESKLFQYMYNQIGSFSSAIKVLPVYTQYIIIMIIKKQSFSCHGQHLEFIDHILRTLFSINQEVIIAFYGFLPILSKKTLSILISCTPKKSLHHDNWFIIQVTSDSLWHFLQ